MGIIGTAIPAPTIPDYQFAFILGAEDNTAGTAYLTSDNSGFAHVDYGRVGVTITAVTASTPGAGFVRYTTSSGTFSSGQSVIISGITPAGYSGTFTVAGTATNSFDVVNSTTGAATLGTAVAVLTTGTANKNDFGYVGPSARILNVFPATEMTAISIRRGRTRPDQFDDVGECTVTVLNQTGSSDPDNTTGRYQRLSAPTVTGGTAVANYASWLQPGMYARIGFGIGGGGYWPLFTGVLEQVEPTDDLVSTATYTFTDRMGLVGRTTTVNGNKVGGNVDTGFQRITKILQDCRLYTIYNGALGTTLVENIVDVKGFTKAVQLGSIGDSALDCIKTIVNGQAGRVFANALGVINVWDRAQMATYASATAGTFTDTPATVAGYGYDEIHTNQAQNFLYNSSVVTAGSTIVASYKNDASIAQYGERRYEVDTALANPGDALALATFLGSNWAAPSKTVSSLSLQAYAFSNADFIALIQLELQQSVRVYRKLPGGRTLDVNCVIEGIQIDITPENRRFTFYLSPKDSTTIAWP